MPDFFKMYAMLFNAISECIFLLQKVQQDVEDMYITSLEQSETLIFPFRQDGWDQDED